MFTPQTVAVIVSLVAVLLLLRAAWLAHRCSAGGAVWFLTVVQKLYIGLMIHWRANRACPFPRGEAAIIVGNHTSPVDPVLIWNAHNHDWPPHEVGVIGFMVAEEFCSRRDVIGWVCRTMQSIPVKRAGQDMRAVRAALQRLKADKWLGIFPEGGINRTPEQGLREVSTGVGYLALKSGVPVYPVWIHNAPRSSSMVRCFLKRARVRVTYGDPIRFEHAAGSRLTSQLVQDTTDQIIRALEQLAEDKWFEKSDQLAG